MTYLLDTNVVSEARKPNASPQVTSWLSSVEPNDVYLSVLVLGEIRRGIERVRRDPQRTRVLEAWFDALQDEFEYRTLVITAPIAQEWGRLNAYRAFPVVDSLLAATALVHDLTLVTRNVRDVADTGVRLLNPFEPPPSRYP